MPPPEQEIRLDRETRKRMIVENYRNVAKLYADDENRLRELLTIARDMMRRVQ
jgi:hypothetical protein